MKRKIFFSLLFLFGTLTISGISTYDSSQITPIKALPQASNPFGDFTNATVISEDNTLWNNGGSGAPSIAVDDSGNIHVAWSDISTGWWGGGSPDDEIMYCNYSAANGWSNVTIISDDGSLWNTGDSTEAHLTIDKSGNIHVVWEDNTPGPWKAGPNDSEIMYCNNTAGTGWSNATVISDDSASWNDHVSSEPRIVADVSGNLHVVWRDDTDSLWGNDREILYVNNTGSGWTNVTVISDDWTLWGAGGSVNPDITVDSSGNIHAMWVEYTDIGTGSDADIAYCNRTGGVWSNVTIVSDDFTSWNTGVSDFPRIAVDASGNPHGVWNDDTDGPWRASGSDYEIMYTKRTGTTWANATIISDDETLWNDQSSLNPDIDIDDSGNVHVVWYDATENGWGIDDEIWYAKFTAAAGWSNATIVSDDANAWNNEDSSFPSVVVEGGGTIHVVWNDETEGWWGSGSDSEIMYSKLISTSEPGDNPPPDTPPDDTPPSIPGYNTYLLLAVLGVVVTIYVSRYKKKL